MVDSVTSVLCVVIKENTMDVDKIIADCEYNKKKIDDMSYAEMLNCSRFFRTGHLLFTGEIGKYFMAVMGEKKKCFSPAELVAISKRIGWNG